MNADHFTLKGAGLVSSFTCMREIIEGFLMLVEILERKYVPFISNIRIRITTLGISII